MTKVKALKRINILAKSNVNSALVYDKNLNDYNVKLLDNLDSILPGTKIIQKFDLADEKKKSKKKEEPVKDSLAGGTTGGRLKDTTNTFDNFGSNDMPEEDITDEVNSDEENTNGELDLGIEEQPEDQPIEGGDIQDDSNDEDDIEIESTDPFETKMDKVKKILGKRQQLNIKNNIMLEYYLVEFSKKAKKLYTNK